MKEKQLKEEDQQLHNVRITRREAASLLRLMIDTRTTNTRLITALSSVAHPERVSSEEIFQTVGTADLGVFARAGVVTSLKDVLPAYTERDAKAAQEFADKWRGNAPTYPLVRKPDPVPRFLTKEEALWVLKCSSWEQVKDGFMDEDWNNGKMELAKNLVFAFRSTCKGVTADEYVASMANAGGMVEVPVVIVAGETPYDDLVTLRESVTVKYHLTRKEMDDTYAISDDESFLESDKYTDGQRAVYAKWVRSPRGMSWDDFSYSLKTADGIYVLEVPYLES